MSLSFDEYKQLRKSGLSYENVQDSLSKPEALQASKKTTTFDQVMDYSKRGLDKAFELVYAPTKGSVKSLGNLFRGASALGEKIVRKPWEMVGVLPKQDATAIEEIWPQEFKPEGKLENVGYYTAEIAALLYPILPGQVDKVEKGTKLLSAAGLTAVAKGAAKEAVDIGVKRMVRTGGDIEETKEGALWGAGGYLVGKFVIEPAFNFVLPSVSKYLEETNLRLTPAQKRNMESKIDDVVDLVREQNITGTPTTRYQKVVGLYDEAEDTLQTFLAASDDTVNKSDLLSQIEAIKVKYMNASDRDYLAISRQVDNAKETIETLFPKVDDIPVGSLNNFKRTTYQNAYNKAGDKVLDGVEHDIGDIARLSIEKATEAATIAGKTIGEFNKNYGVIIDARKLLKIAKSRKEIGFMGKLITTTIGGSIGTAVGGGLGTAAGVAISNPVANALAGTGARSILRYGLDNLAKMSPQGVEQTLTRLLLPLLNSGEKD